MSMQTVLDLVWEVARSLLVPVIMGVGYFIIDELKKHGHQTAVASAIVRGMGAGFLAAQSRGVDPFSPEGRALVARAGAEYMAKAVPDAMNALAIDSVGAAERVHAELGVAAAGSTK